MAKSTINIALIGQKFMGKAHSNAWLKVAKFFDLPVEPIMHTVVGRNKEELKTFAARWGWQNHSTDWKKVISDPAIDLVDIGTPIIFMKPRTCRTQGGQSRRLRKTPRQYLPSSEKYGDGGQKIAQAHIRLV